jgi:uncharacterized protein (DUF58 family)
VSLLRRLRDSTGLTRTGGLVLLAAVVGWLMARALGGKTLFLIAYGAVVVVGVARFMGRNRPDLEATRTDLPPRLRQGQQVDVAIRVKAGRRIGVFVLEEELHPRLGRSRTIPVPGLAAGAELDYRYSATPRLRGVYQVGPLYAVWTDPFGLTRRRTLLLPAAEVIVHPSTEVVHDRPLTRQWEDPPTRPPESKPWPSGFEFYGMRDYVRGDELRRVVWKAVARTGRLLIRESEQGITDRVVILVDTDRASHVPGDPSDTFEAAIKTAASVALRHLTDGFSVTLLGNQGVLGQARRGMGARIPLMDDLARLERSKEGLDAAVGRLLRASRADAHTVIITPRLAPDTASRLKLLIDRGTRVLLVLVTWEEADPFTAGAAAGLGCQVVRLRPLQPLEAVFRAEVGAGRA